MQELNQNEMINILQSSDESAWQDLLGRADRCRRDHVGSDVYLRGLIEFSNVCDRNCFYCGLRSHNLQISRYRLPPAQVLEIARQAYDKGFNSLALQSGEAGGTDAFNYILDIVKAIKDFSSQGDAGSLGITLSIGELSYQQYKQLWDAGAHRYLLRIESSDPQLFKQIHPPEQHFEQRLACLDALKDIGYQVGTGVMIGLPTQTYEQLAGDLAFCRERNIDMLGMGPYIPHPDTPLARLADKIIIDPYTATVKMLALARLQMPDINIVASTALQTIHPEGLKMGLKAGANVVMPVLTPEENRRSYSIYVNKAYKKPEKISQEIKQSGYQLTQGKWGDSPHYYRRMGLPYPTREVAGSGETFHDLAGEEDE